MDVDQRSKRMTTAEMWEMLERADASHNLVAAGSKGRDAWSFGGREALDAGVVGGHAYSVQHVLRVGSFRLLHLSNPWGQFEPAGAFSDDSDDWDKHPEVGQAIRARGWSIEKADDGKFWMTYEDFCKDFVVLCFAALDCSAV